jgi:DNA primase
VEYLKGRGVSGEIAQRYGIGYAPPGWDSLLRALGQTAERQALLVSAGLLIRKDDDKQYDRFRDRVMFPIRDRRGRTIAFGGRVIGDDTPKYLNSPETPIFHKGRELYGLWEARQALRDIPRLLVVEGYMDVVALAQFGLTHAVATLGTATTAEHLERLYRTVKEVVFCFDGDAAGRRAAWRALENALPVLRDGREARFLFLPEGEDPDTLVRRIGRQAFEQKTADSIPLSQYFFETLSQQVDTRSVDGRAHLVELARPLLQRLPDSVFRDLMIDQLAQLSGLAVAPLEKRIFGNKDPQPDRPPRPRPRDAGRSPVRVAIRLLLEQPELGQRVTPPCGFADLDLPGVALLVELLEILWRQPHLSTGGILEHWRDRPEQQHLAKLATLPLELPEDGFAEEFCGAVERLTEQRTRQRTEQLLFKEQSKGLTDSEKSELKQLLVMHHPSAG